MADAKLKIVHSLQQHHIMRHPRFFILFLAAVSILHEIEASCPIGECRELDRGCVSSVYSTRCSECSANGYIVDGRCVCYDRLDDPERACLPLFPSNATYDVSYQTTHAKCACGNSDADGYFLQISDDDYKYGAPNPPTCSQCLSDVFGPKPGGGANPCTKYGGPNPNQLYSDSQDSAWWECNGGGYWNPVTYSCVCYPGYQLTNTGLKGRNGTEEVWSCTTCAPGYGPPVPTSAHDIEAFYPPTYCRTIFTIDPLTGLFAECGGHGEFLDGNCFCFQNGSTQWVLYEYLPDVWSCMNATQVNITAAPVTD